MFVNSGGPRIEGTTISTSRYLTCLTITSSQRASSGVFFNKRWRRAKSTWTMSGERYSSSRVSVERIRLVEFVSPSSTERTESTIDPDPSEIIERCRRWSFSWTSIPGPEVQALPFLNQCKCSLVQGFWSSKGKIAFSDSLVGNIKIKYFWITKRLRLIWLSLNLSTSTRQGGSDFSRPLRPRSASGIESRLISEKDSLLFETGEKLRELWNCTMISMQVNWTKNKRKWTI